MNASENISQTARGKFDIWIKAPLERLCKEEHTDFVLLLIALAALERYLREKSGNGENDSLNDSFFNEFGKLFLHSQTTEERRAFWKLFRHGLAHQMMMNTKNGFSAKFDRTGSLLNYDSTKKTFAINPPAFAQEVLKTIEGDFETFIGGESENHQFSKVSGHVTESVARCSSK